MSKLKKSASQLFKWGLPGTGLGLTVHFFLTGQVWPAVVSSVMTLGVALLTIGKNFVKAVLERIESRSQEDAEFLGDWIYDGFRHVLLQVWWSFTDDFRGQYYQQLIYSYRDFRTQGLKTKGPFTLDLEKVFVPLRVAPESLNKITSAMIQDKEAAESLEIWDFLSKVDRQSAFQRIAIIGPPGSGKSTLLEHLALTYAKGNQRRYHRKAPKLMPVLLYLRDLQEAIIQENPPDLAALIVQQAQQQKLNPPPHWFDARLKQGQCLVMLDGLDEVADADFRKQVSQWVDRQIQTYAKTPFLITSRPFGYRSAPLEAVGTVLEVKPFNLQQMQQFVANWYLQNEIMRRLGTDDPGVRAEAQKQSDDLIYRIKNSPPLASMALNPLLLTMIATVHCYRGALPGRRVELYGEICDVLLGRRQEAKGIADRLTAAQKKSVLQVLALNRMTKKTREFKLITGMLLIRDKLEAVAGDKANPEEFLRHIETGSGLLIERQEGVYEFAHKSFQEYLAAAQVKEKNQDYILTRNIDDLWWSETIRLYAAQSDASNLIWAALQRSNVVALTLAYDCLEEGLSVADRDVRQELEERLEAGLESMDPEIFKLAAEVKLARRLNNLVRIDEKTEIDMGYISCAEYQLFIDEKRAVGENRQPDHWEEYRFKSGQAADPILGVRASDATEFCGWLTQRSNSLGDFYLEKDATVFSGEFKVRFPNSQEVKAYPHPAQQMGCWMKDRETMTVSPIPSVQWQIWKTQLVDRLARIRSRSRSRSLDRALDRALSLDRSRSRSRSLVLSFDLSLSLSLDRARALDRARIRARALSLSLSLDRALSLDRDLALDLSRALDRALDLDLVALDFDLARAVSLELIHDYGLAIFLFWLLLSDAYAEAAQDSKLRAKRLTRQACSSLSDEYAAYRDEALDLYAFCVLIDERRKGNMPAWEGIRIVREKIN